MNSLQGIAVVLRLCPSFTGAHKYLLVIVPIQRRSVCSAYFFFNLMAKICPRYLILHVFRCPLFNVSPCSGPGQTGPLLRVLCLPIRSRLVIGLSIAVSTRQHASVTNYRCTNVYNAYINDICLCVTSVCWCQR